MNMDTKMRNTKEDNLKLKEEIIEYMNELEEIMGTAKDIPNNTGYEFSPFLFMHWRLFKK